MPRSICVRTCINPCTKNFESPPFPPRLSSVFWLGLRRALHPDACSFIDRSHVRGAIQTILFRVRLSFLRDRSQSSFPLISVYVVFRTRFASECVPFPLRCPNLPITSFACDIVKLRLPPDLDPSMLMTLGITTPSHVADQ